MNVMVDDSKSQACQWDAVCNLSDLTDFVGVRALFGGEQVALFKVANELYALSAIDPFTKTAVLSRGIVGDVKGELVVASPIYKQHFSLKTGVCLEENSVRVKTYPVRENQGKVELGCDAINMA